jgi:class 3 adenylate cyclase/tetratricopeptide (TPR) repeat protein
VNSYTALSYLPFDRQSAIAQNITLPEESTGSVLHADISGFTPLTELMVKVYGARRGAERLTHYLDMIYDALISQVSDYGGSVIGFSGDAILCWFPGKDSARQAVTVSRAMLQAVADLDAIQPEGNEPLKLAVKLAVTTGHVRRFLVGNPTIQVIEVLTGQAVSQLHSAVKHTRRGQLVIDTATFQACANMMHVESVGEGFFQVNGIVEKTAITPQERVELSLEQVRAWLLPEVYERLQAGLGEFLTELRPVAPLFLKFTGIDFEQEGAGEKLNLYLCEVQDVLERYRGRLIQFTTDDKGCYFYAVFGAPLAHEDDALRAVSASTELRQPAFDFIDSVQIGISQGMMRVGAYGSNQARTYGVLGDDVNLAARLMEHAGSCEVIVSERVRKATQHAFNWKSLPAIMVKGKREPVAVAQLISDYQPDNASTSPNQTAIHVGRSEVIEYVFHWLEPLQTGKSSGLLHVCGEPGIGKTHLLYVIWQKGIYPNWRICSPDRILQRSLYPFITMFRQYFEQKPDADPETNRQRFEAILADLAAAIPTEAASLEFSSSFIGALLGLHQVNSPYELSAPKDRFLQTLAACKTFLLTLSLREPLILQLEDTQWLDSDSLELLAHLCEETHNYPFAILTTGRSVEFPLSTEQILLKGLGIKAATELATGLLNGQLDAEMTTLVAGKTGGNPFFIEQLLLSLKSYGVLEKSQEGGWHLQPQTLTEVPASINEMMVARLDTLRPEIKAIVQNASVIGNEFDLRFLSFIRDEDTLAHVTSAEKEGIWTQTGTYIYRFEHHLMRDTAYDMQLSSRLREQHNLVGQAIEKLNPDAVVDLAYHFGRADNIDKERYYARIAGEHSAARYANREAVDLFSRALELTILPHEQFELIRLREAIYDVQGLRDEQFQDLERLRNLAEQLGDDHLRAGYMIRFASYAENTGHYNKAVHAGQSVIEIAERIHAIDIQIEGYLIQGRACGWQAKYREARIYLEKSLHLAEEAALPWQVANSIRNLGIVAFAQGLYDEAYTLQTRALSLCREIGDRRGESMVLNSLSVIAREKQQISEAKAYQDEAIKLSVETGDLRLQASARAHNIVYKPLMYTGKLDAENELLILNRQIKNRRGESATLLNLGAIAFEAGEADEATKFYHQSLEVAREIGFRQGEPGALIRLAELSGWLERHNDMLEYARQAQKIAVEINRLRQLPEIWMLLGEAYAGLKLLEEALSAFQTAEKMCWEQNRNKLLREILSGLALVHLRKTHIVQSQIYIDEAMKGVNSPTWANSLKIFWRAFSIYQAGGRSNARFMDMTYGLMQQNALLIDQDEQRRRFMEAYPIHREVLATRARLLNQ